jgi:hypothetical protein
VKKHELRVALLTDAFVTESGRVVDGVANTLGRLAEFCGRDQGADNVRLEVFTHATGTDRIDDLGRVRVRRYQPRAPMEIHPGWWMDHLPHRPAILRDLRRFGPDLLHIASPGSMGLVGLTASRRLGRPILMSYQIRISARRNKVNKVESRHQNLSLPRTWLASLSASKPSNGSDFVNFVSPGTIPGSPTGARCTSAAGIPSRLPKAPCTNRGSAASIGMVNVEPT